MARILPQLNKKKVVTLGSCCGHGIYLGTIVCRFGRKNYAYRTDGEQFLIPRIRRFYRRDKNGFYYIPECLPLPPHAKARGILEEFL
jgi:hypothetical protein